MGTTIWIDNKTRADLRRLQEQMGARSVNETIRRLLEQPAPDAATLFRMHRRDIQGIMDRHGIRRIIAFGSRARGDAGPTSDLDLAVEIRPGAHPLALLSAEVDLEEELGLKVQLVELPSAKLEEVLQREGVRFAG